MKITKFGHSCVFVEEGEARILIDPGVWSGEEFKKVQNLDAILITHEHRDHASPEAIKQIVSHNPRARIFTNEGAGKVLSDHGISNELLKSGNAVQIHGVSVEAVGEKHALIHKELPVVDDTGYFIAERFFHPGDAFHIPTKPVGVLALPVVAPWMRLAEAIEYAGKVNPRVCFPIHDGFLKDLGQWNPFYLLPDSLLKTQGIEFKILEEGKSYDFI